MTRVEKVLFIALMAIMVVIVVATGMTLAQANGGHLLVVDGTTYQPTKVVGNGPTVHYFTPGTDQVGFAYTERHTWSGNGSGNLPCEGMLHWIDNANVLTISHCEFEDGSTTTTSTPTDTTTTSLPVVTTTTQVVTTTTTVPATTTTAPTTSTTVVGSTTTTTQVDGSTTTIVELCGKGGDAPCGGVETGGGGMADVLAQVAPGPIETCNGSGAGGWWVLAGAILLGLAVFTLMGAYVRAVLIARKG